MTVQNTVAQAHQQKQSIWLDYLSREIIESGKLRRMIEEQGLRGITSNPKIFDSAISNVAEYQGPIQRLLARGRSALEIYEALAIEDIRRAADLLHPYFGKGLDYDGFVSLEVSPHLAYKTDETVGEARRLWQAVNRPNVFIKVPATKQGLPAIRKLISEGINVNVTLLFGLPRYREVTDAYISGLDDRASEGKSLRDIYSVASFFLSRIDVLVDPELDRISREARSRSEADALKGEVALASAKLAHQISLQVFGGARFHKLAKKGARKQWLLWGSTSTKNPEYSDVKYVDGLVGPETINTVPEETLNAFLDHGSVVPRLERGIAEAQELMEKLAAVGIDIDEVTERLVQEGVLKFSKPYDHMISTIQQRIRAA